MVDFNRPSSSFSDELARPPYFLDVFFFPGDEFSGALANGEPLEALILVFRDRLGGVEVYCVMIATETGCFLVDPVSSPASLLFPFGVDYD